MIGELTAHGRITLGVAAVIAFSPGCLPDHDGDSGAPAAVDCGEPRAYPVAISQFDADAGCYLPAQTVCFHSDNGPTGYGQVTCLVPPDGDLRVAYIPYGVELPPPWQTGATTTLEYRLDAQQQAACDAMLTAARTAWSDPDAGVPVMDFGQQATLGPACDADTSSPNDGEVSEDPAMEADAATDMTSEPMPCPGQTGTPCPQNDGTDAAIDAGVPTAADAGTDAGTPADSYDHVRPEEAQASDPLCDAIASCGDEIAQAWSIICKARLGALVSPECYAAVEVAPCTDHALENPPYMDVCHPRCDVLSQGYCNEDLTHSVCSAAIPAVVADEKVPRWVTVSCESLCGLSGEAPVGCRMRTPTRSECVCEGDQ